MIKKPFIPFVERLINLLEKRSFKVGKEGFAIDAPTSAASIQSEAKPPENDLAVRETTDAETEQLLEAIKHFDVPPIVRQQEQIIIGELTKLKLDANRQETIDILVKHLAVTQIYLIAERVYRTIFGSQIALLKYLNMAGFATAAYTPCHRRRTRRTRSWAAQC